VRCLAAALVFSAVALAAPAAASADADLRVTKTGSPAFVAPQDDITYTITVTHAGGADTAANVELDDVVPTGTTFVSFSAPAGWTAATPAVGTNGTVTATRPTFAPADSPATFTLVVNVNEDVLPTTTIFNTATISSTTADPNTDNNSSTASTEVSPQADLGVTKNDDVDVVAPGDNITYSLLLNNNGPNTARNVDLSDTLPPGTTFVSASQMGGPTFTLTTPAVGGTGTIHATRSTLVSGDGATFAVVVKVDSGVSNGTTVNNTAGVSSTTPDPNAGNNSDTEATEVNRLAELSVSKGASPNPVLAGGDITYTLGVTNSGPATAESVTLSDVVPAGTTFVSASQTSGPNFTLTTPTAGGTGTFTATRSTLAVGASANFTMVVRVASDRPNESTISNTVTVDGVTADSNPGDDSATTTTTVSNPPSAGGGAPASPPTRSPRLTIGEVRMGPKSAVLFVPLTCEFSPSDVCSSDVTIRFDTVFHKLDPIVVRDVRVRSGETVDVYAAASRSQRRKMLRIGTMPITVTATNAPGADVSRPALLHGTRRR